MKETSDSGRQIAPVRQNDLIVKTAQPGQTHRLLRERKVVDYFHTYSSPYINRYYLSSQPVLS